MPSWCECMQKMVEPSMCGGAASEDHCDHIDYDLDVLTGRASCNDCDHSWYMTTEQIRAHERLQRRADAAWAKLCAEDDGQVVDCDGPLDATEIPF